MIKRRVISNVDKPGYAKPIPHNFFMIFIHSTNASVCFYLGSSENVLDYASLLSASVRSLP